MESSSVQDIPKNPSLCWLQQPAGAFFKNCLSSRSVQVDRRSLLQARREASHRHSDRPQNDFSTQWALRGQTSRGGSGCHGGPGGGRRSRGLGAGQGRDLWETSSTYRRPEEGQGLSVCRPPGPSSCTPTLGPWTLNRPPPTPQGAELYEQLRLNPAQSVKTIIISVSRENRFHLMDELYNHLFSLSLLISAQPASLKPERGLLLCFPQSAQSACRLNPAVLCVCSDLVLITALTCCSGGAAAGGYGPISRSAACSLSCLLR